MLPTNFIKKLSMCIPSPLSRLFSLEAFHTKFIQDYKTFVTKVYHPGTGLAEKIMDTYNFHEPYLARDFWFHLDTYATSEDIKNDLYSNFIPFVKERMKFLEGYLQE